MKLTLADKLARDLWELEHAERLQRISMRRIKLVDVQDLPPEHIYSKMAKRQERGPVTGNPFMIFAAEQFLGKTKRVLYYDSVNLGFKVQWGDYLLTDRLRDRMTVIQKKDVE